MRGLLRDDVISTGFDALDGKDYRDWFRRHGAHDLSMDSPWMWAFNDLAFAYAEFARARRRVEAARREVATCAISGAVGTFAQVDPRVEEHVARAMGLEVEPISTQIIPRDRHAMYFATLGVVASSIERLATEIRHLQRTEVLEAEEFFSEKQKGALGYRCPYTSLGYAETDVVRALKRIDIMDSDYFVTLPADQIPADPKDVLNQVSRPVAERIAASPGWERITDPSEPAQVFRRRR